MIRPLANPSTFKVRETKTTKEQFQERKFQHVHNSIVDTKLT